MPIEAQAPESTMPRPRRRDPAILKEASLRMAERCLEWGRGSPRQTWAEALERAWPDWNDGYELARALERDAMIRPDRELVDILDEASHVLDTVLAEAEASWVKIVGFTPIFAIGDEVTIAHGTGPVFEIDEKHARYIVDVDRRNNGGFVMNAEDVHPAK